MFPSLDFFFCDKSLYYSWKVLIVTITEVEDPSLVTSQNK